MREVRARLDEAYADGLTTQEQHTVPGTNYEIWSADRTAIHDAIIDDLYERAADVPNEHPAIIAGGLPGAGKSTVLQGHAEIDRSHFLTIDPDEIKAELAKRDLIPYLENLSPMEASGLVHEESSHIAKALAQRAYADGKNIVWDITMSSRRSTEGRIDSLRAAGYTHVDGIFVDISIATSLARAESRHRIGQEQYRAGRGQGGRFVAPEVIEAKVDQEWGSVNRKTFEEVKHRFDGWTIYDNSADDFSPVLIDSDNERRPGG